MFQIIRKQEMAKGTIIRFDISAPKIAKKVKAGQFVIIRVNETGERIPLTVADKDEFAGIITNAKGVEEVLLGQQGNIISMIRSAANDYGEEFIESVNTD